jgi:hypothetical protein
MYLHMLNSDLDRLVETLDAGCREVRADVEQLLVGGEW